jgi:coenzyme PQQ precursor peptide PqqA
VTEFPIPGKRNPPAPRQRVNRGVRFCYDQSTIGCAFSPGRGWKLGACAEGVSFHLRELTMRWSKPKIVEVAVGLEINSYACAGVA